MRRTKFQEGPKESSFKGKVPKVAKQEIERGKAKRKEYFGDLYDKPKEAEFSQNPKTDEFRAIGKDVCFEIAETKNPSNRSHYAALAIYPVLCMISDFEKDTWRHISLEAIGTYSGIRSQKTVHKGLLELESKGLLEMKKEEKNNRRLWYFKVSFWRKKDFNKNKSKGGYFKFYTYLIKRGIWQVLSNKEKALYLGLRSKAKVTIWDDGYIGEDEDEKDLFANREFDEYNGKVKTLCKDLNIGHVKISNVLNRLEFLGLIHVLEKTEYLGKYLIHVFFIPVSWEEWQELEEW